MSGDPETKQPRISHDQVDLVCAVTPEVDIHVWMRRAAWIMGAIAVLLICFFDLGSPLAINDDWVYAWDVRHLNPLDIHLYPTASAPALVQIVWAWAVTLGHFDQRLLRLSIVPFVLLTMYALHRLARALGAGRTWSALAAIAPLAFPVFTAEATTFMSDVPYVALLLVATLGAVRWSEGRKWIVLCVVFATLAALQRQVGALTPLAVTLTLLLYRRSFRLRPDIVGLFLLWVCCLGAVIVPTVIGVAPLAQGNRIAAALMPDQTEILKDLLFLPGMAGLSLAMLLPGLVLVARRSVRPGRAKLWLLGLGMWELLVLVRVGDIFPGNVFTPLGFNLQAVVLGKPLLLSLPVYLAIEAVAVAALLAFVWCWRDWWPAKTEHSTALLLISALLQFLPLGLVHYLAFDRYYLPAVLLLVPVAARAASRTNRPALAAGLALVLAVAGAVVYVACEQDLQAWQVARNNAVCLAYQYASPSDVSAGYEANAVYVEVPYYERTGAILGGLWIKPGDPNFSLNGPADPIIQIVSSGPTDSRSGYNYSSLSPGKVVLVPGPKGVGLDIKVPSVVPTCPGGG
jgi:hypothetical protein